MKINCPDCGEIIDTENEDLDIYSEQIGYSETELTIICPCCGNEFEYLKSEE